MACLNPLSVARRGGAGPPAGGPAGVRLPYQYPIFPHLRCRDDTVILDRERYGLVSYFHTKDNP